jgi:3-hydroxyacyl-CoA dehydrogenase
MSASAEISVSIDDAATELRREAALRRNLYRRWVERGTMTQADAETHMARITAALLILEDLTSLSGQRVDNDLTRPRTVRVSI